jgi:hypothetical protein
MIYLITYLLIGTLGVVLDITGLVKRPAWFFGLGVIGGMILVHAIL